MKISFNKFIIKYFLISIVIVALFAFGDYSNYVYAIKIISIAGLLLSERIIHNGYHLKWVVAFIVFSFVSVLWSQSSSTSFFYIIWTLQAMALGLAIGNSIHEKKDIEYVLKNFFIAGLILALRVFMNTSLQELGQFRIGTNLGYNANELALKASIACISGIYFFLKQDKKWKKIILMLLIAVLVAIVLFTGSRKGSIMILIGIVLYNTLRSKSPVKFMKNIAISIVLFIGFFILVTQVEIFYNVLGKRLLLLFNMFNADAYVGNSIANRMNMVSIGMELLKGSPLIGYGIGNFSIVSGVGLYAHNNYVELLVDLGLIGTILYYSMYVYNVKKFVQFLNSDRGLLALLLTFTLIFAVLEYGLVTFQGDYVQIIIAICYAAIRLVKRGQLRNN